ncbi:MAG: ECF transporter S component [Bacillota bacterium]
MHLLDVKTMTAGALLLALSLLIPIAFGGVLGIVIGPFSATLASHVPVMISMMYGPFVAGIVALGSAIGFFLRLGPVIALRAAMHIPVAIIGAILLKKKVSFPLVLTITAPIHALLEGLVVLPFLTWGGSNGLYGKTEPMSLFALVAGGTLIHHALDSVISVLSWQVLKLFVKPSTDTELGIGKNHTQA